MTAIAKAIRNPNFNSLTELWGRVEALPTVELCDAGFVATDGAFKTVPSRRCIVTQNTNEPHEYVSNDYKLVQHKTVMEPFLTAIRESGDDVYGTVVTKRSKLGGRSGRVDVLVFFKNNKLTMGVDGADLECAVRLTNSHDKNTGVRIGTFVVDWLCENGMIIGDWIESVSVRHVGDPELQIDEYYSYIQKLVPQTQHFVKVVEKAQEETIPLSDLRALVIGALPSSKRTSLHISDGVERLLTPAQVSANVKGDNITLWGAYSAVTNYFTHMNDGNFYANEKHITSAQKILHADAKLLIDNGNVALLRMKKK